jgi:thiol-disulfide isomerase/thioredoxin
MRFIKPYYIINTCIIASYFVWRGEQIQRQGLDFLTDSKEGSLLISLLLITVLKARRAQSLESILSTLFLYFKFFLLIVALFYRMYWLAAGYFAVYFVQFVLFPQPFYDGPQRVEELNPTTLTAAINDPNATWLINFYARWSPHCLDLAPVFATLSLRYTTAQFKFGRVDVGRYTQVAQQFNVSLSGTTKQLPTLIQFRGGSEQKRLPQLLGSVVAPASFRSEDIVEHFRMA